VRASSSAQFDASTLWREAADDAAAETSEAAPIEAAPIEAAL
jgi:hypothetical protein